jgi:hypothetical protein
MRSPSALAHTHTHTHTYTHTHSHSLAYSLSPPTSLPSAAPSTAIDIPTPFGLPSFNHLAAAQMATSPARDFDALCDRATIEREEDLDLLAPLGSDRQGNGREVSVCERGWCAHATCLS